MAGTSPAMTDEMTCLVRDVRLSISIVKQRGRASSPAFFLAPGTPSSLSPLAIARETAPGGATIVRSVPRSLSRDAGASWRAIAASSLLRRAALCENRPLLPPWLRVLGEAHGGRSAPESQAPGGRLIVAAGRSSRRRPGAGETSSPGRGRRIRSHPHDAS